MAEFPERLCLNLTDTLSCYIKLSSDFFQRAGAAVIHAEPEAEHFLFSLCQGIKHFIQLLFQKRLGSRFRRYRYIIVLYKVSQMAVLFLSDRSLKRNRLL